MAKELGQKLLQELKRLQSEFLDLQQFVTKVCREGGTDLTLFSHEMNQIMMR
jgi:hypothetical protein